MKLDEIKKRRTWVTPYKPSQDRTILSHLIYEDWATVPMIRIVDILSGRTTEIYSVRSIAVMINYSIGTVSLALQILQENQYIEEINNKYRLKVGSVQKTEHLDEGVQKTEHKVFRKLNRGVQNSEHTMIYNNINNNNINNNTIYQNPDLTSDIVDSKLSDYENEYLSTTIEIERPVEKAQILAKQLYFSDIKGGDMVTHRQEDIYRSMDIVRASSNLWDKVSSLSQKDFEKLRKQTSREKFPLSDYPLIKLSLFDILGIVKKYKDAGFQDYTIISDAIELFSGWADSKINHPNKSEQKKFNQEGDHAASLNGWVQQELIKRYKNIVDLKNVVAKTEKKVHTFRELEESYQDKIFNDFLRDEK